MSNNDMAKAGQSLMRNYREGVEKGHTAAQLPSKGRLGDILEYGRGQLISPITDEEIEALSRFALAAHEQEPVMEVRSHFNGEYVCRKLTKGTLKPGVKLYRNPAPVPAVTMPADLHPDTKKLVADFSAALAEKLYKAQLKYGYSANWKNGDWHEECLKHFHQHIGKGDPRDVAAYCAFMWYHGWKTESQASVPAVPDDIPAGLAGTIVSLCAYNVRDKELAQKIWNACRAAMLNGAKEPE